MPVPRIRAGHEAPRTAGSFVLDLQIGDQIGDQIGAQAGVETGALVDVLVDAQVDVPVDAPAGIQAGSQAHIQAGIKTDIKTGIKTGIKGGPAPMTTELGSRAASVSFESVTKAFGEVVAVDRVSFEVQAGELVTLLGPSGCGKTTTLRMIAGLEMATGGRILIGDQDVTRLPATDRDVCMVFQSYALFPHMSVIENVSYGFVVTGMAKREARERAEQGLELVGLAGYGARLPSELSGGQQQRVAVARALVLEPQVLLFDEPLSNLDAKLRRRVREEIREIQQDLGLTVVYVTHDQEEALAVSDRIIVMRNAAIAQEGTPRDLYERPDNLFVADFIGDANLLPATVRPLDGGRAIAAIGGVEVELPVHGPVDTTMQAAVRPEAIQLAAPGVSPLEGTVDKVAYLGNHMEYEVDSALGQLFVVDASVEDPLERGARVSIGFSGRIALVRDPAGR